MREPPGEHEEGSPAVVNLDHRWGCREPKRTRVSRPEAIPRFYGSGPTTKLTGLIREWSRKKIWELMASRLKEPVHYAK